MAKPLNHSNGLTFFVNEKEWFDGCFGLAAPSDRRFLLPLY
jgi:hypothetical protein